MHSENMPNVVQSMVEMKESVVLKYIPPIYSLQHSKYDNQVGQNYSFKAL